MSVIKIEEYRQQNGDDILKVYCKPIKNFPDGKNYFYAPADAIDLVNQFIWCIESVGLDIRVRTKSHDNSYLCKEYGKAEDNIQVGLPEINYEVFKELNESYDYTPYTDTFGYLDTSKIRKQLKYEKNPMIRKQLQIDLRNSLPVTGRHSKGCKRKRK